MLTAPAGHAGSGSVVVLTPWFPNSPDDREGNFVYESGRAVADLGWSVGVLVARPYALPLLAASTSSGIPDADAFASFREVALVRHLSIPRNLAPAISDRSLARSVVAQLVRMVRASSAALIHAHTEALAPAAVAAGDATGAKVAVTIHGINTGARYFDDSGRRRRIGTSLARADRVILVGESLRPFFRDLTGRDDHFRVVPNGYRLHEAVRSRPALAGNGPVRFISVSNLHEGKGIDDTLRALARLHREASLRWTYTIVGDGYQEPMLRRMVRESGLESAVHFTGALPPEAVGRRLAEADVFVLPSSPEAFGMAYLEAMASGLLAIGIRGQGPSSFIEDGISGLLVEAGDGDSLAGHLATIVRNRARFQALAAQGARVARERFTWSAHARQLSESYREILAPLH